MSGKLKTAVMGATGYSGLELTRILLRHPRLEKPVLLRRSADNGGATDLADVFPALSGNGGYPLHSLSWASLKQQGVKLLFLATPHEVSRSLVPEAIANGLRVIDLSGAWRLKEEQNRAIYSFQDADAVKAAELTNRAVYGLAELNTDRIQSAELVANPGCSRDVGDIGSGALAQEWISRSHTRDHFRFEVRRIRRRQGTDVENTFCFGGRQPVCIFGVQSPAHRRDH